MVGTGALHRLEAGTLHRCRNGSYLLEAEGVCSSALPSVVSICVVVCVSFRSPPKRLTSLPSPGDVVFMSFSVLGRECWFRGIVKAVHLARGTVDVDFDDGDKRTDIKCSDLVSEPPEGGFVPTAEDLRAMAAGHSSGLPRCVVCCCTVSAVDVCQFACRRLHFHTASSALEVDASVRLGG